MADAEINSAPRVPSGAQSVPTTGHPGLTFAVPAPAPAVLSYHDLIEAAKRVPPGDTRAANRWLLDLAAVLDAGTLMPSQRAYLYRLRRIWRTRAAGKDARWNVFGSMPGAKPSKRPEPAPAAPVRVPGVALAPGSAPTAPVAPRVPPPPPPAPPVKRPTPQPAPAAHVPPAAPPAPAVVSLLEKYGR